MCRTTLTTKNYLVQNINSAEIENAYVMQCIFSQHSTKTVLIKTNQTMISKQAVKKLLLTTPIILHSFCMVFGTIYHPLLSKTLLTCMTLFSLIPLPGYPASVKMMVFFRDPSRPLVFTLHMISLNNLIHTHGINELQINKAQINIFVN